MSSMSGSFRRDPNDLNRRRNVSLPSDGDWPKSLRWGYVLCVVSAILMLLSGLLMLSNGYIGDPNEDPAIIDSFLLNMRFNAWFNIIAALVIAVLAAQLRGGGRISRRWLAGVIALSLFVNVASFAIQVGGLGLMVIVVFLAFAALFLFRPAANEYMQKKSEEIS